MRRLFALTLIFTFLLVGCSNTASNRETSQEKQEPTTNDNSQDSTVFPDDPISTPSDIPATPSDLPELPTQNVPIYSNALDARLGEEYKDTQQVVIVSVDNETTTRCTVKVFGKENGQWILVDSCKGYVGYKGCVDGTERMQNTNKTPLGIYRITYAMGIAENPGTIFPYTQIVEGMYWDLNDYSDNYNRLVYTDPKGDREVLWKMGAQYNYVLNTSYNENQVVGKGGAIFIHCSKNEPTAGCVSMPEENMKTLIKWVDPSKNPVMLSCLTDDVPSID